MFDVNNVFKHHIAHGNQAERYTQIREEAKRLAHLMEVQCPESREKSLALTNLQQSVMWANASIAINESHNG